MAGIIRWLAPHMGYQYQQPQPQPFAPAATAGIPGAGSTEQTGATPGATHPLVGAALAPGQALPPLLSAGVTPQQLGVGSTQKALHDAWMRYAGQGQWMHAPPQAYNVPQAAVQAAQQLAQPIPPAHAASVGPHPASIRLDFHKPPEPPEGHGASGSWGAPNALDQMRFLHPGIGQSSPVPSPLPSQQWGGQI